MKVIEWSGNTRDCNFEYHRVREGPNRFITYYKNSSRLIYDLDEGWKNAWRVMGLAKFTTSAQELKAWCQEMHDQYGDKPSEVEGRKDTSFASDRFTEPTGFNDGQEAPVIDDMKPGDDGYMEAWSKKNAIPFVKVEDEPTRMIT